MIIEDRIINRFKKGTFEERIEILTEEFDLISLQENRKYFFNYFKTFNLTSNVWYNSVIIYTASRLEIVNYLMLDRFLKYLTDQNNYLVKLSVLDYLIDMYYAYPKNKIEPKIYETLNSLKVGRDRLIVKNQAILLQIYFYKDNTFCEHLLDNLKRTLDYRAHIRLYNTLINYNMLTFFSNEDLNLMILISEQKDLGKGTLDSINRFRTFINSNK